MCSCFRNEGPVLSSDLITEAVAATKAFWGDPPSLGMVSFVDRDKTRRKRDPGRCYRRAGWRVCGETKGGLVALQIQPEDMPRAELALGSQECFAMAAALAPDKKREAGQYSTKEGK